ncbi:UNVERIFIED_CONTAM: hypothetical protein Sangu_2966200 [Sesamum angustifolium]|uniref:Bet v I/Major latex protein domain-containing protein n=1 Tax=Sesamum angustifolium TaxID=2727405 RepID=A0AAW2IJR4_9LAMI
MEGSISMKLEVNASANDIWKAYGSLELPKIIMDTFPDKYSGLKVLKGDGHSGTVVEVYFAPGVPGPTWYREEYVVVDDVKRYKLAKMLEGGVLEQGFKSYETTLTAIEVEGKPNVCFMTGAVDYVLDDIDSGLQVLSGSIGVFYQIMRAVADYVIKQQNDTATN